MKERVAFYSVYYIYKNAHPLLNPLKYIYLVLWGSDIQCCSGGLLTALDIAGMTFCGEGECCVLVVERVVLCCVCVVLWCSEIQCCGESLLKSLGIAGMTLFCGVEECCALGLERVVLCCVYVLLCCDALMYVECCSEGLLTSLDTVGMTLYCVRYKTKGRNAQ